MKPRFDPETNTVTWSARIDVAKFSDEYMNVGILEEMLRALDDAKNVIRPKLRIAKRELRDSKHGQQPVDTQVSR